MRQHVVTGGMFVSETVMFRRSKLDNVFPVGYIINMYRMVLSEQFLEWVDSLKDMQAKKKIAQRIECAKNGNFGDYKQLADNLFEMRIFYGPGYRIYYTKQGNTVYFILLGGDKSNQSKDIETALNLIEEMEK